MWALRAEGLGLAAFDDDEYDSDEYDEYDSDDK